MANTLLEKALELDKSDPLKEFRSQFHLPVQKNGKPYIYFCGNSLGLQPKSTAQHISTELEDWATLGVEGHLHARNPWLPYHEFLTAHMAEVVGGLPSEVVVMNTLSVNIHLMAVSFYRPTKKRFKILMEYSPFPSDYYAMCSQAAYHGFTADETVIMLEPKPGGAEVTTEDILKVIEETGDELALIFLGGVNYYTGQLYDVAAITKAAHAKGIPIGFDMAHGAGNIDLQLHAHGPDFAVWCTYKYLNSGPGSLGGVFVHERHHQNMQLPRFSGWWGHDKQSRFKMPLSFHQIPTVEGWQLSNPPILSMAAIKASLEIFHQAGMDRLRAKGLALSGFLIECLQYSQSKNLKIITPIQPEARGCQVSIQVQGGDKKLFTQLEQLGIIADWREPDVIRIAPVPLYNTFEEVARFANAIHTIHTS